MGFSENLQFLRDRAGMTQEQLAEALGVSRQSVSKWESAASYPEMEKLVQMCGMFQVDLDTLVRGDAELACVEDTAGYDKHMNWYAKMIAGGVGLILLGIAVMFAVFGLGLGELLSVALLLTLIAAGAATLIVGGILHGTFEKKYPVVWDFYAQAEKDRFDRRFAACIAGGVAAILVDIAWLVLFAEQAEAVSERAEALLCAGFFLGLAAAVTLLIWAGMQKSKYDVEGWNREHDQSAEAVARRKKIGWICGCIMLTATVLYLAVGFGIMALTNDYGNDLGWRWGWIVYPIGGVLCSIVATVVNRNEG